MEEKTEQLRDIFLEVADEESVTETQAEQRGSLIRTESVDDRLSGVVGRMRERFDFRTDLDEETLVAIVERFYDGETDAEMADALGVSPDQVFTARTDLHILRDEESAVDRSAVREHDEPEASDAEVAAVLGGDGDARRRRRRRRHRRGRSRTARSGGPTGGTAGQSPLPHGVRGGSHRRRRRRPVHHARTG
ncbi:MAG: hypothetical protein A07HR67_00710 [uncultured archaeon A07HR67]|nr:MAG: hypothetical protein A07HR67_00710 [uncultured archaeon A07HR67]